MHKARFIALIFLPVVIIAGCAPKPVSPGIAPKDPDVWIEMTAAEPETLDPSLSYDSAAGAILQNTLDTLIFYQQDSSVDMVPMLAVEVPTRENGGISSDGMVYTFKLREGVVFHDGTPLTVDDVAFTFIRNILAGGTNSPQWMLVEPIYGAGLTDIAEIAAAAAQGADLADIQSIHELAKGAFYNDRDALSDNTDPVVLEAVCEDLKTRITADALKGTVTFSLAQPWAPFLNTLAGGSWGGIQSKTWVRENGGWDGDCANWTPYYGWTAEEFNATPLGVQSMGTGPFMFAEWNPGENIILISNPYYWVDEPLWESMPTGPASLETVIFQYVPDPDIRLAMAASGDADNVIDDAPGNWPALDALVGADYTYREWMEGLPPVVISESAPLRRIVDIPALNSRTDIGFQFSINTEEDNPFIGSGTLDGNGIPPDFFQDVHVRRAFSYCFDYDHYLETVHLGEGERAVTLMLPGMSGYDANAPHYTFDLNKCQAELSASYWTTCTFLQREAERASAAVLAYTEEDPSITLADLEAAAVQARENADACETVPLAEVGFRLAMVYNSGNAERQAMAETMQDGFQRLGEQFIVEVVGLPRADYERTISAMKAPVFAIDWLSDYNDTHNWLSAFTCSYYPLKQGFPEDDRRDFCAIGMQGVQIVDPQERDQFYKEVFNPKYHAFAPAILLHNLEQRVYQPRYVWGWYANSANPNQWFYPLWKE